MTKKIKRIVALIMAGILLICVSFASLAEETEEIFDVEYTENETTEELTAEETADNENAETPAETNNDSEETIDDTTEEVTDEANDEYDELADDEYDELADDEYDELADIDDDDLEMESQIMDDDGGYIDPDVVSEFIPEITEELIENSEKVGLDETEEEAKDSKADTIKLENDDVYMGETVVMIAKTETADVSKIIWETRDEKWEEDKWEEIGKGRKLELIVSEENADNLFRFTLEDGTVSEEIKIEVTEKPAEEISETDEETDPETDEENPETTEENDTDEAAALEDTDPENEAADSETAETQSGEAEVNSEETAETQDATENVPESDEDETAAAEAEEEIAVPEIHAWIEVTTEEEENAVTLTAAADAELTGVNTWQVWNAENEKWQKIGYGDIIRIENPTDSYRFVTQDGAVSEVYEFTKPEELPEPEEQPEADQQIPYPEDAAVTFNITWDDQPALGATAHFNAQVSGLDDYTYNLQWQWSPDGESWQDAEGETGIQMDQVITEENNGHLWRINVIITGLK